MGLVFVMKTTESRTAILAADGKPLKESLAHALRMKKIKSFGLVLPLLVFLMVIFFIPIFQMLFRSVDNPEIAQNLPKTKVLLEDWDKKDLPDEAIYASFAKELTDAYKNMTYGQIGKRLNYQISGMRSLINKTARKLSRIKEGPYKEVLIKIDKRWGELETWKTIEILSHSVTLTYYLAGFDLQVNAEGKIISQPKNRQIYVRIFVRTLAISLAVTTICLLLSYPIAYLLATLPAKTSNMLMILVLLPFWTSLLVRTTAWIVLLQTQGVLNDILIWTGILSSRVQMIYNLTGTLVAMSHILLPFMVLPLFSVMKTIPATYINAAQSLGANPVMAFLTVYLPQTMPGIGAGSILVFILAMGYYITPALVGGRTGSMISNFIAYHMQNTLNWGLAAALSCILLVGVLVLYWLYDRLVGTENIKLG